MPLDQQRPRCAGCGQRLGRAQGIGLEPARVHAIARQARARGTQALGILGVERDLQRAAARVLHRHGAGRSDARDEIVVEVEAAAAQLAQRTGLMTLDVRRQHAGRGLRRAGTQFARVEDGHLGPGRGQLMGAGAADHAGADDDDFGRLGHAGYEDTSDLWVGQ